MSTQATLRVPLTIPVSLRGAENFSVQFSVHDEKRMMDAYVDKHVQASELTAGDVATIQQASLPRFSSGAPRALRANYWKGSKFCGVEDLGLV